jgi:transcriptional regulator with XRE-family HTH domain
MTKEEFLKKLGKQIVAVRKQQGISQSELARLCGKDRGSIYKVEEGVFNPSIFYLLQLAKALKVKLSELVDVE